MQTESGGNPSAVSPKGATGAFQFMPATAKQYGVDPTDPESSAVGAAKMYSDLLSKYQGDLPKALAAYNWGQGNVDRQGLDKAPPETQKYIQKVSSRMDVDSMIDSLPDISKQAAPQGNNVDAMINALPSLRRSVGPSFGGTLQIGNPFGSGRIDTGIALSPSVESGLIGAGKAATRLVQGVRQLLPGSNDALDAQVKSEDEAYKPLAEAHPIATTLGEMAPTMATANPLAMAALAGTSYGSAADRGINAGLAGAGGLIGKGIGRLFGPQSMAPVASNGAEDFLNYAANSGNKWGIPLRAAQTTDSKPVQIMDAVAANLPVSSGVIAKAKDATYSGFNRALSQTFGENTTNLTPEVLGEALDRSGKQIGGIMQKATAQLSPEQAQEVAHLSGVIADLGPEGEVLNNKLGRIIDGMTNGQAFTGQTLRMMDSSLGRVMGGTQNGDLRYAAAKLQNIVRDAATDSLSQTDAAALKLARQQNFNVRQVADAAKGGTLSPAQLLTQVNSYQRNARYGGGNDLAELAQWAKKTLPDSVPNSGTAQRAWYQSLLSNPLSTIGAAGGAVYGADKAGIDPQYAAEGLLLPYLAARGMAGAPASAATKALLSRAGLLGVELPHALMGAQ